MANRAGKYKLSKKESELSLRDGGDIGGTVTFSGGMKSNFVKGTATVSVTAAQSGKTFIVGPAAAGLAADTIFTLPTAADGLFYRFTYVGGAADAQDFQINTGSDTNFFIGGTIQHDIGATADNIATHPNLSSNSRINILTPDAGTWFECFCDGTNWFYSGYVNSATNAAVTFADQ
jgi:hypothetical protein